jgi:hypothetical protein
MAAPAFDGFTRDAFGWFAGLEADNSKRWFAAHRETYEDAVRRAMNAWLDAHLGASELPPPKSRYGRAGRSAGALVRRARAEAGHAHRRGDRQQRQRPSERREHRMLQRPRRAAGQRGRVAEERAHRGDDRADRVVLGDLAQAVGEIEAKLDSLVRYLDTQLEGGAYPHLKAFAGDDARSAFGRMVRMASDDERFERGLQILLDGIALDVERRSL